MIAFLGVGSNQDDPAAQCRRAVAKVASDSAIRVLRKSSLYRTEPVGVRDQEWFVNGAVEVRTTLSPLELLKTLKAVEASMGRRPGPKWGPRVIDLDILLYGRETVEEEGLVIPHPEMHRRGFVLIPLAEIASYAIHPVFGVTIRGLLGRLEDRGGVLRLDDPW